MIGSEVKMRSVKPLVVMKWVLSAVFLGLFYMWFVFAYFGIGAHLGVNLVWIIVLPSALVGAASVIVAIDVAVTSRDPRCDSISLRKVMVFSKVAAIPFFVGNLLLWLGVWAVSLLTVLSALFTQAILIPLAVILTYCAMLVTSADSIATIVLAARAKLLRPSEVVIHVILQLIFIADVISAIVLAVTLRRRTRDPVDSSFSAGQLPV